MKTSKKLVASAVMLCQMAWLSVPSAQAAPPGPLDLSQAPLFYGLQQKPIVMLNLTKDNQLHFKAYTDYSDLNDDGQPELTYLHSFDYYGYWDPKKCYEYIVTSDNAYFAPKKYTADKFCDGTTWSGNFLNWVATSRMDSVRKILYGGLRSTDTATNTILERNFLPMDAHSWAKFYDGKDLKDAAGNAKQLKDLMPTSILKTFTAEDTAGKTYTNATGNTTLSTAIDLAFKPEVLKPATPAVPGNYFINTSIDARVGDQIKLTQGETTAIRYGRVIAINKNNGVTRLTINIPNGVGIEGVATSTETWKLLNLSSSGITFCNTTFVGAGNSTTAVAPPLIRVARGNTELWGANERWQCGFQGDKSNPAITSGGGFSAAGQNGNYFPLSGLNSNAESPPNNPTYNAGDYTARIQACVNLSDANDPTAVWSKREGCKAYGTEWKPVGLLQRQEGFRFGLFTGSYAKNIAGGVLRSNVGDFSLEVDTNGIFLDPTKTGASPALIAKGSIVKALNSIRMTGYSYNDGTYFGAVSGDQCNFQLTDLVLTGGSGNTRNQGSCTSWGNPIAEMYTESLRYLAGASANKDFEYTATEGAKLDVALGLSIIKWEDPINENNYCVPLKNIVFNAATTSYDGDQVSMAGLSGVGANTAASYTEIVGNTIHENINSGIAGRVQGVTPTATDLNACTAKTGNLSTFRGVCPEGAPYSGSYLTAGTSFYARNNRIRSIPAIPASAQTLFPNAYKVETFGVSLANNTPKIDLFDIDANGKPIIRGTITPAYRLVKSDTENGGGTIVDFKIIKAPDFTQNIVTGSYYLNWEDSGFGGDFDQDVVGRLEFTLNRSTGALAVTTSVFNESTGGKQGFGYVLSGTGTTTDGPHFHSGIEGFTYQGDECIAAAPCQVGQLPTTKSYTLSATASTASLKDPLYYAAKWGSLVEAEVLNGDFDKKGKKDLVTGADGPDGVPDNYFNVSNPAKLAEQLESLFVAIADGSSSSSAAASTTRASSDTLAFTASFDGKNWGGKLQASSVDLSDPKEVKFPKQWEASEILNATSPADRKLFTTKSSTRAGVTFEWGNLSAAQQLAFGNSEDLQKYIAGVRSKEGTAATDFRKRLPSVLGDIINSNPAYSSDKADFSGAFSGFPGYAAFFKQFDERPTQLGKKRKRAIFVGANDGMLHAFNGEGKTADGGGSELFGYVPSMIYSKLPLLAKQDYTVTGNHKYSVDGSPFVSDANIASASSPSWKTILIGGLGAGGAGFFTLDVTRPDDFKDTSVLWEFTADDAKRTVATVEKSDLGASTTQARIARTKVGADETWYAVFGNGYNSNQTPTHGNAVLFTAKLGKTGGTWTENSDFYKLILSNDIDNGLSTPTLVDYDRDGFVDFMYAGDLQGNLWRIDARDANPASWTAKKLFASKTALVAGQPITTAPQVTRHPNGGLIIMFGTGKYLETPDVESKSIQALYGIIDADPTSASVTTQSLSDLNPITIVTGSFEKAGPPKKTVIGKILPVSSPSSTTCITTKGWYANLNSGTTPEGERNVFDSALVAGTLFMPTLIPSGDLCLGGGKSFLYSIDPFTGCASDPLQALASESAGIQSTPRFIAVSPAPVGLNSSTGGGRSVEIDEKGRQTTQLRVILLGNSEGTPVSVGNEAGRNISVSSGRLSWREIVDQ
jgi:type IV pilus assembly protein PilY1